MYTELHWIYIDYLNRKFFIKYELKLLLLKTLLKNKYISLISKYYILFQLSFLPKFKLKLRSLNRCVFTGRTHNVLRFFKYSRFFARNQINKGNVVGWRRYSW